jgi:hypothetical protein
VTLAKICVYCGNKPGTTKDHVPPKKLFPEPRPTNTVTVPCCEECQKKYKKDEDVFAAWINFGPAGASKVGKALWNQKLRRTYKKDYGVRKVIADSFRQISLVTPGGIYLGKKLAIKIDRRRLINVLKKIILGLFYVEYRERLPEEVPIDIIGVAGNDQRIEEVIKVTQEATVSWENIFEYRHTRLDQNSFESLWIMSFYRRNYFVAIVDEIKDIG